MELPGIETLVPQAQDPHEGIAQGGTGEHCIGRGSLAERLSVLSARAVDLRAETLRYDDRLEVGKGVDFTTLPDPL